MARVNRQALLNWLALKRDRGYRYCIAYREGEAPRICFTKDILEARIKSAIVGGVIGDLETMQVVW